MVKTSAVDFGGDAKSNFLLSIQGSAYTAFLKIASVSWKTNENMKINFGMIGTKNFKFMEKAWGHRYIYKSLQDKHKWASSWWLINLLC